MEGIKHVSFLEISLVIIEIRGVENSELAVPVNKILVHHTAFLTTNTRLCVLICSYILIVDIVYATNTYVFTHKFHVSVVCG